MLINSLPLFFTEMGYASPWELLIIFLGLFVVLLLTTPQCENTTVLEAHDNYLFAAWCGHSALTWVFWPFFLILNIGLYATDYLAKSGIWTVSSWDDIHFIFVLPIVWWSTAIWRCSANSQARIWGASARLMTVSVLFDYVLKLIIRFDYPRLFFNCEDLLLDYGSCF